MLVFCSIDARQCPFEEGKQLMPFLGQQLVAICPVKWRRSFDEFAS
jgi:hypothetical protein